MVPAVLVALAAAPLGLAACGSGQGTGSGSGSASGTASGDAALQGAGAKVIAQLSQYRATVPACLREAKPVVCVEAADRALGADVHAYANVLAVGHGFSAPGGVLTAARNAAQTLANSLEILGDAQPTQANYDQVRNTFDVDAAITALRQAVAKVDAELSG